MHECTYAFLGNCLNLQGVFKVIKMHVGAANFFLVAAVLVGGIVWLQRRTREAASYLATRWAERH